MSTDLTKLAALLIAGAVWLVAACALLVFVNPALVLVGLLHVAATSLWLAQERTSTTPALSAGWVVAAGLAAVAFVDVTGSVGFGLVIGAVYASVFYGGWMATAFFLLLAMEPERRVVPRETEPGAPDRAERPPREAWDA